MTNEEYYTFIQPYEDAKEVLLTRLHVLKHNLYGVADIAGVRVICYFVDDIYNLVDALKRQSDLIVVRESDYVSKPKPNGYRSYHVIVGIPVYCLDGMEYFPVEIQFRTMSMDFWASMEHRILYKMERKDKDKLAAELKNYADMLVEIESRFELHSEGKQWQGQTAQRKAI